MHRTISLDYGVVLEGKVECHLDSGEVKTLNRGDVCVQRATNHAWKNVSEGWVRMMFVLLPSEAPVVGGKTLGTDLGSQMPDSVTIGE
jgi:quercetin dioxygenase-like cupin family protein